MKKLLQTMTIGLFLTVGAVFINTYVFANQSESMQQYGTIDARTLEILVSLNKAILVDARLPEYDDGRRILNALYVHRKMTDQEITQFLPDKTALYIVYCGGKKCNSAKKLMSERLIPMGYTSLLYHPDGTSKWLNSGRFMQ